MTKLFVKSTCAFLLVLFSSALLAQAEIRGPRDYGVAGEETLGVIADGSGIEAGQAAPDAELLSIYGDSTKLSDLWADEHVLLIFYRGGWCPFCNAQIRDLAVQYSEFEDRSVVPVLVSVDEPDTASLLTATYDVPFPVMSDSDLDAHEAYNVVLEISDEQYEGMKARGIDLEEYTGTDDHVYAVASSFLIEQGGQLVWSHVDLNYRNRPSPEQYMAVADELLDDD